MPSYCSEYFPILPEKRRKHNGMGGLSNHGIWGLRVKFCVQELRFTGRPFFEETWCIVSWHEKGSDAQTGNA